jgi:Rhodopirellula transposase DDE domain
LICIPPFVSEILVSVGTTILSEATRDASLAAPRVWKLPDLWTHRTRPQVFAKPQTVSHSSHTPHRPVPSEEPRRPQPLRIIGHRPTDSAEEAKKELVGAFAQRGREWQPTGTPVPVRVHDFLDDALGKIIPYGVYDLARNTGWVSVGIDHDTPAFAVASIARWWRYMGRKTYPDARELLITADAGGSNSARARLWKVELQRFADRSGLTISVSHFPPGTSKWNKIEHRLFCHITENWRGRPLIDHETVVQLIGSVRTTAGLTVKAKLDTREYPLGVKVPDADMDHLLLTRAAFHGDWNYTIHPRTEPTQ